MIVEPANADRNGERKGWSVTLFVALVAFLI